MTEIIIKGMGLGLLLSVAVGPVFFALIQVSLQRGFWAGVIFALGVLLGDITCMVLAYFGISQFSQTPWLTQNLSILGGTVFILFGISSMFKKVSDVRLPLVKMRKRGYFGQMLKGYAINIINPSVLVFWIGVVGFASADYEFETQKVSMFLSSILVTVFLLDLAKAYTANKLRPLATPKLLKWVYRVVGLTLIGFGVHLLFFAS